MKFNHLKVPEKWQHYWSRYPEGYTILEALISWVSQVDSMVDNQNKLNDNVAQFRNEIDDFVGRFDERLQTEVTQTLNEWQTSGFIDVVISEAIQWELDDFKATTEQVMTLIKPTGTDNDSPMLNTIFETPGRYLIAEGDYNINEDVWINSNTYVEFAKNARFILTPHEHYRYHILNIRDVDNVEVVNAVIIGDKDTHLGTAGEWGMGISIENSDNIIIRNCHIKDCWGDGIYIGHNFYGPSTKKTGVVHLINPIIDNVRRNGISVCGGRDITIDNPIIKNVKGTAPEAGIDIEPESVGGVLPFLDNLTINNPVTRNCNSRGISVHLSELANRGLETNITINNHTDVRSGMGIALTNLIGAVGGSVTINNPVYRQNKLAAIFQTEYNAENTPTIKIESPTIIDFNTSDSIDDYYNSAITSVIRPDSTPTVDVGNMIVNNPLIINNLNIGGKRSIHLMSYKAGSIIKGVKIISPITLPSSSAKSPLRLAGNNTLLFKHELAEQPSRSYSPLNVDGSYTYYRNDDATGGITYNLQQSTMDGLEIKFEARSDYQMKITPHAGGRIIPAFGTDVSIYAYTKGSSIILKKQGNDWLIVSKVGDWDAV